MNKFITLLAFCSIATSALASEVKLETIKVASDVKTIERGVDALMTDCHSCHSLKYIKYRDLIGLGIDKKKVDEWRGDLPLDAALMAQMSVDDAMQSFGKAPPDLSLMTKARDGGANYVYSYLVGYYVTPEGVPGNHIFPETKMPDILGMSEAADEAQRTGIKARAQDIVSFLAWAADPHEHERETLGYYVLAYLLVLTTLLYFVKNQVWSKLK
ncbi:MAG TPA: cytochrome c1 [Gallionella sp.]|nr:cytochrome c1 [Gallionella sp.]